MTLLGNLRFLHLAALMAVSAATVVSQHPVQAQTPNVPASGQPAAAPGAEPVRPLTQGDSLLSLAGGQRLMAEASQAVSAQNYTLAIKKLQDARQIFNQISNFYQDLASSFSGIDNRVADTQRRKALETAQMRDQATYQLALVHRAQNQSELAVPLLVQIIRSQAPTRELGQKAYQQLFELGFVDAPYTKTGAAQPTTPTPAPAPAPARK